MMMLIILVAFLMVGIVCPRIWPSLSRTVQAPNTESLCGRYVPLPATERFLSEKYAGGDSFIEINSDKSFVLNIPTGSETEIKSERGLWQISERHPCYLNLATNEENTIQPWRTLRLEGQKPPYVIEVWNNEHEYAMEFCSDPKNSEAVRALAQVSAVDWMFLGIMGASVLVLPFFLPLGSGKRAFKYPFLIIFVWGIWRMGYFDIATNNDIPGMGYIACAFFYSFLAWGLFAIRGAFVKRKSNTIDS